MGRRVLEVELAGFGSLVRGYGSRDLVMSITGRTPVWSSIRRGWSVQESTARDIIAAGERQGFDIVVIGPRAVSLDPASTPVERPDPGGGLW